MSLYGVTAAALATGGPAPHRPFSPPAQPDLAPVAEGDSTVVSYVRSRQALNRLSLASPTPAPLAAPPRTPSWNPALADNTRVAPPHAWASLPNRNPAPVSAGLVGRPTWLPSGSPWLGRAGNGVRPIRGQNAASGTRALQSPQAVRSSGLSQFHPRPAGAMSGSQFMDATRHMTRAQREQMVEQEVVRGNVPSFMHQFRPVSTSVTGSDGRQHTATYYVTPDYVAIGSDQDFVRMPMSPLTAQRIADTVARATGRPPMVLPTRKMVNDIYDRAEVQLSPRPQQAGPQMMSNAYYERHQRTIEGQLGGSARGRLIAGHKKDVVLSNRLDRHPSQVAIYGWHQPNGKAIQPLSTVHENTYADYSHGVRYVAPTMVVDGRPMATADVMRHPVLSSLLSDEGPIHNTRYRGA